MDVMRVDTADGAHRFAICVASYGYMGDLMRASEKLRWMGPPRYNTAGTITLFKGRSYQAKVAYKPADASRHATPLLVCYPGKAMRCVTSMGAVDANKRTCRLQDRNLVICNAEGDLQC